MGTASKYLSRWWKGSTAGTLASAFGFNWFNGNRPYLSQCKPGEIAVVFDPCTAYWFQDLGDGSFTGLYGAVTQKLRFEYGNCRFVFTDCNGDVWYFTETGEFSKVWRANARLTESVPGVANAVDKVVRAVVQAGKTVTDANQFDYVPAGANAGKVASALFTRSTNPTLGIRRIVYSYYGADEEHGSVGDLRTATEQVLAGTTWVDHETSYFRYYKAGEAGFEHGLRYALGPQAFARLAEDPQVADPLLATDAQVARYADHYYEYDADRRVTKSTVQAGLLTYLFAYATSTHGDDPNHWKLKITTTNPDGSREVAFNNFLGQAMVTDFSSGGDHWVDAYRFDADAREIQHAHPSAVVSYNEAMPDLAVTLRPGAGLIELTEYYASTTATPTTPGGARGYVKSRSVKQGSSGTPVPQSLTTYWQRVAGAATVYPVAATTAYRNDDGTGAVTTGYAYTWFGTTAQMQQRTTTLPVVPTGQNGTGSTDTVTEIYDIEGHRVWLRDERGFITFSAFDWPTGAMVQQVQDVDGAKIALPPGWGTPAGGGLNLVTDSEPDALGRTVRTLGPLHDVNGQPVRRTGWTVYRDLEDEVVSGRGYTVGTGVSAVETLVNPVSISRTSEDGRVSESITVIRSCVSSESCDCLAPEAGPVESAGPLTAADCFPQSSWVRWSVSLSDDQSLRTATRSYFRIPESGAGAAGVNYDETLYGYDVMARQNRVVDATGTIGRTVYDVRGLTVSTWTGTNDARATDADPTGGGAAGNDMVRVAGMVYDGGAAGGDGNLTETTAYVDAGTTRVASYGYDFRDRQTSTTAAEGFYEASTYDNLSRVVRTDRRDTNAAGTLVGRGETKFDDRGRAYQSLAYAVNPATGAVGNALVDNTWYDPSGNVLCSLPAGSQAFAKSVYDGVGRTVARYAGYNPAGVITPASVATDTIFEQSETQYDAASNVVFTTGRQRWDTATGSGPLKGSSGTQPKSRDSYMAAWYDGVDRAVASANYGTNAEAGPPARPSSPPESTDTVLVGRTAYNARGEAFETIDPAGQVNRTYADDAGRTLRTVQNYIPPADAACLCPGSDRNVVTDLAYGPGGLLKALTARNPDTGDQVTRYEYGVTLGESDLASNALLRAEVYPDAADSSDRVSYSYNRQGQAKGMRDRNGTVHSYAFDGLGRPTGDAVTVLATGVDGAVRRLGRSYEIRGMVDAVTSFSDAAGTTVVNQVKNGYNDFTRLAVQYQEHAGPVNTGTTPRVNYAYADGSANTIRPTAMTYPNGRVLNVNYAATSADKLSRLDGLTFDGTAVAGFDYLGLGTFVRTGYPQPGIQSTLATGTGANRYAGLDRFGRVVDKRWDKAGTPLAQLQYGYDRSSNRTFRKDLVAQGAGQDLDELYRYDGLNQLRKFHRGLLVDGDTAIASPGLQQGWDFDATGNWKNFTQFDPADADRTLDQQRVHNRANEITQIARTVGANWATPAYDRNGNTIGLPQAPAMTALDKATWDAWNRLVKVEEPDGAGGWRKKAEYGYDGQTWRIVAKAYTGGTLTETRELYYSSSWQALEERGAGATQAQYVWNPMYIDALVLRDRSVSGSLNERLYAIQDANFNTIAITDATGAVKERYAYTPFGIVQYRSASWRSMLAASGYGWVYLFQGGRLEAEVGLTNFRHRDLMMAIGRWTSRDPIGYQAGLVNIFEFANNNPLKLLDAFGLLSCEEPKKASCEDNVKAAIAMLEKCDDAKKLIEKCKDGLKDKDISKAVVCGKIEGGSGSPAAYTPTDKVITIREASPESQDPNKIVSNLVSEIIRACQRDKHIQLTKDMSEGKVSRDEYMRCYERSGFELAKLNTATASACIKSAGWDKSIDRYAAYSTYSFDQFYAAQLEEFDSPKKPGDKGYDPSKSHAGRMGIIWDNIQKTSKTPYKEMPDRVAYKCPFE